MLSTEELYNYIIENYHKLEDIPDEVHLFCPRVSEGDSDTYENLDEPGLDFTVDEKKQRIKDSEDRYKVAYDLALLLGLTEEQAEGWTLYWKARVDGCLKKCDKCIRNWHSGRELFLRGVLEMFDDSVQSIIEQKLNEMDKERIDAALIQAEELLKAKGPLSTSQLTGHNSEAAIGLCEALCSMAYLSSPENRVRFNYVFEMVQQKKPLRLVGMVPTKTFFLFDKDQYRNAFARKAWTSLAVGSLKQEDWDWAVRSHLAQAMSRVSPAYGQIPQEKIQHFWEGCLLIIQALSGSQVVQWLRAMDVHPNIYMLALEHLARANSVRILVLIMQSLQALMEKSETAFWGAYDEKSVTPNTLAEQVIGSPAFPAFLAQSFDPVNMVASENGVTPVLAFYMKAFLKSLALHRRTDLCEHVMHQLIVRHAANTTMSEEGRATCILAGLYALHETLEGFLDPEARVDAGTSLIMINTLINLVVKYKEIIMASAKLHAEDRYTIGRSVVAESIIKSALALDSKALHVEWNALHTNLEVNQSVDRQSPEMWEAFAQLLWSPRMKVAANMLMALMPLRSIEQFRPDRNRELSDPKKLHFNARYRKTTEAIGMMLRALSDFSPGDLHSLCVSEDPQTLYPIVASIIHGEQPIREGGTELMRAITGEMARDAAVAKMLSEYFDRFLDAFADAVRVMTFHQGSNKPFSPINPILQLSQNVVDGLCDASDGLLRSRGLSEGEVSSVKRWWDTTWMFIAHTFRTMRTWHEMLSKQVLEECFRTVMELADKHMAQDGLLASVFSNQKRTIDLTDESSTDSTAILSMQDVLKSPCRNSIAIVDMLPIRDTYLVELAVNILVKLIRRLVENDMPIPKGTLATIHLFCKKNPKTRDYGKKSNLTDTQRVEILKALGEDTDEDDEVQFITSKPLDRQPAKKATALTDYYKPQSGGAGATGAVRTTRDDVMDLTSSVDKHQSTLARMLAHQATLPAKTVKPPVLSTKPTKPVVDQRAIQAKQSSLKEARMRDKAEKAKRDAEAIAKAKALRMPTKLVPGEGSGLAGITAVRGKEHTTAQKDEMMVGSSSEDEDESDDDDILVKGKPSQKSVARDRKLPLPKGPVKKIKLQRSAKDMRARLIPPMHVLHSAILEWDIFHEGNDPPNGYNCYNVANTYTDPQMYKSTFFPLLVSEAWRSFVTAKDEATSKPYGIKVLTRMSVDSFIEVTTSMPAAANKERQLGEGDIVILSRAEDPRSDSRLPHCLARVWKTTYKNQNIEVIYRLSAKSKQILPVLVPGADFYAVKITNMTTIEREYAALESLQYYDLMDEVLKAQPSPILKFGEQAVADVMQNYQLNPGQAKAILNAKENDGFTLVQGPPGTGKTKTIVAMVGALLTSALKGAQANANAVQLDRPGNAPKGPQGTLKKLLICAPSNAAVDEIVLRLKQGVKTLGGSQHKISVLRLGRSDAINAAVKDVTLDELVNARMNVEVKQNANFSDYDRMHKEAKEIKEKIFELRPALEAAREQSDRGVEYLSLQRQFNELKARQAHLGARIDTAKDSGHTYAREVEIKRRQVQQEILDKAQVICSTLSGSGHEMFKNLNVEFETVIIDEAAQCVELSALIPLKYGCSKAILVGDPKQLPPTVLSQSAARYGYDQSLFVRMQRNHPEDVHLLDRQYRMHPEISQFPSQEFYEGKLEDGADMANLRLQPWHASTLLGPYRFFDVQGAQSKGAKGQSLVNHEEIKVALQLYRRFRADYPKVSLESKIGIITPYKAQLFNLRDTFIRQYGEDITKHIEFNTTDAFQGRECEIIIFSCVRASPTGGIGFMTDIRRMNVGLTRAKSSLWILGDARALVQGEYWKRLINDAQKRDRFTQGDILRQLSGPGAKVPGFNYMSKPASPASLPPSGAGTPKSEVDSKPDVDMLGDKPLVKYEDVKYEDIKKEEEKPDVRMMDADDDEDDYEPPEAYSPVNEKVKPEPFQSAPKAQIPRPMPTSTTANRSSSISKAPVPIPVPGQVPGRPIIKTSPPPVQKRYLDADSDHPAAKRFKNAPSVLGGRSVAPRAPRSSKPAPAPKDPSAMEVLGLAPPERAPPPTASNNGPGYGQQGKYQGHGQPNAPGSGSRQGPPGGGPSHQGGYTPPNGPGQGQRPGQQGGHPPNGPGGRPPPPNGPRGPDGRPRQPPTGHQGPRTVMQKRAADPFIRNKRPGQGTRPPGRP